MRIPCCILALTMCVYAADTPVPEQQPTSSAVVPAPQAKYDGWVFSGLFDGYVDHNLNGPTANLNALQNFDLHTGTPRVSLAKFTIDKSDQTFGIHLDVGVGETLRLIHAMDASAIDHKGLRYVEQMYVIAKPSNTHGTEIDFGQFVSSAGAEVIESSSNWNYTRSLLFVYAVPYYHFGLKTTTPLTKELTVGFQLTNAWNTVWGNNSLRNVAFTMALTKTKYTYSLNYLEGPNHINASGNVPGRRNLVDTTILFTANSKINAYINGDWGRDNEPQGGNAQWIGIAAAARYRIAKLFAFAGRVEIFDDERGFTTRKAQVVREATGTGEFKLNGHLLTRLEFRHDASNRLFFDHGAGQPLGKGETTVTLGFVALLGPVK